MTANYLRTQKFTAQWCRTNLSEEEKNQLYQTMLPKDEMRKTVLNKFADPSNLSRIPVPVCIDSTRLRVQHSGYHPLQKSSFYTKYQSNVLVLTNASTLEVKVLLHSPITPGIRYGKE